MSTTTTAMTPRERALAILRFQSTDRLPIVHFGFWHETLEKWADEGHIPRELATSWGDGNDADVEIGRRLGFDGNWYSCFHMDTGLRPGFTREVIRELPDGSRHVRNGDGVVVLESPDAGSIPAEIAHLLKDRASWEQHYRARYAWHADRVDAARVRVSAGHWPVFAGAGEAFLASGARDELIGIHCGSLIGSIRNIIGVEGLSYLAADDPDLLAEIVAVNADLAFRCVEHALAGGARFDFGHFWEDICYKSGPLVSPRVFAQVIAPHYRRITSLLAGHGVDIVSVDCDGKIDALIPAWLDNGVNTMFPIEVGTWRATLAPWRTAYGPRIRGVGGMDKVVFSHDAAAINAEIERLRPLVGMGGYIPCPDHRIAPDASWDLVRHYCDRMHAAFG
jgi:uroporphyrinogen decarboxylase